MSERVEVGSRVRERQYPRRLGRVIHMGHDGAVVVQWRGGAQDLVEAVDRRRDLAVLRGRKGAAAAWRRRSR